MLLSKRAKSSYIDKIEQESGNITYVYDKKHIEKRNKGKEKRLKKLFKSLSKLRSEVKKDLKSEDLQERYTALAVALIDETYARVGNTESAEELKHYGLTTWLVKHVSFRDGKAHIKFVGKSGVDQHRVVEKKELVSLLKDITKDKKKNDKLFSGEEYNVIPDRINSYLRPFGISAKDIRGFHANEEMRSALKKVRKGKLPAPGKERERQLKEEFKEALEIAADKVGHQPNTLKNQYLTPGLSADYLDNGKIDSWADREFMLSKVAENCVFPDTPNYESNNFVDKMTYISHRVAQNLIKTANEMDSAKRTADSLYKIIEFAFYRVPPEKRKHFLSRLRGKVIKVNPTELSIKQNKPDSAINQSLTFAKGLLSGLSPAFVQRVLAELTNKINIGIMGKMAQEKIILSKRAIEKTAKPKEKHTGAMLALMTPKSVIKKMKGLIDDDSISSDGLHLTLLYLGKAKDLNKTTIKAIENAVAKVCERHEPLKMRISGLGHFTKGDDGVPVFAIPNAKGLSNLQADLEFVVGTLIDFETEHGWVPHMTVGYSADDKPKLPDLVDYPEWIADCVRFQVAGEKVADIPLGKKIKKKADLILSKRANELQPIVPSPNIVIEPYEPLVQKAVQKIKSNDPSLFNNVTKIVVHPGTSSGELGHVEMGPNKDPREIHLYKDRIQQAVKQQIGVGQADTKALEHAMENAMVEVITHEIGHIGRSRTQQQILTQPFFGESEAERQSKEFMGKVQNTSDHEAQVLPFLQDVPTLKTSLTPHPSDQPLQGAIPGHDSAHSTISNNPGGFSIPLGIGGGGR